MTTTAANQVAFEDAEPVKIKRDGWGRYLLPHPETGKEQAWTRVTTIAGTLADRYGLERWAQRNVVLGIGVRADLYARAAACTPDDKDTLNGIVAQAQEAAASQAGANLGSALHQFTEHVDRGRTVEIPDPWNEDVAAYVQAMSVAGISVMEDWIERIVLIPELGAAGTCDRICNAMGWALPRIADLKTAKDVLRYGMAEIPLQLAMYAHASHWFDIRTAELHEMPKVDQERALVMHLPVGKADCTLIEVDIAAGWEAAQLAMDVRAWRKRNDLAQVIDLPVLGSGDIANGASGLMPATGAPMGATPEPSPFDRRFTWVRDRVAAIVAAGEGPEADLAGAWSERAEIPTFKDGGPRNDEEIDYLAGICSLVEMTHSLAFHDGDPAVEPKRPTNNHKARTKTRKKTNA